MFSRMPEDMLGTGGVLIRRRILVYSVLAFCLWETYVMYHMRETIERQHRVILMLWDEVQRVKPKMWYK